MIQKCTGQDYDTVVKDCDRDNFILAENAVKYGKHGLVDKIVENR
jgi:ATP-dependent protease ClpP protease subunit